MIQLIGEILDEVYQSPARLIAAQNAHSDKAAGRADARLQLRRNLLGKAKGQRAKTPSDLWGE